MKITKIIIFSVAVAAFTACQKEPTQITPGGYTGANKINNTFITNGVRPGTGQPNQAAEHNTSAGALKEVPRPQKIADMMAQRGEQDSAAPTLKVVEPANGATVGSSTVKVKLEI